MTAAGTARRAAPPGRAADAANHARHRRGAVELRTHFAGLFGVDAVQRRGEPVGVALATDLPVGDDVDSGTLHVADCHDRGVVLGLLQYASGFHQRSSAWVRGTPGRAGRRGPPASRAAGSCPRRSSAADAWDSSCCLQDHVRRLLGDHDDRRRWCCPTPPSA